MTKPRSPWRVASYDPKLGGTLTGTCTLPFAPEDTPVDLVVGESVTVRLHSLGGGKVGLLGFTPITGRLSRDELQGLTPRAGPVADDAPLRDLRDPFPALSSKLDDRLFLVGFSSDTDEYGFRGGAYGLGRTIVFEGVEAHDICGGFLGACAADPLEGAFFERLLGRPIASPVYVLVHPWSRARSLSFVAARSVSVIPPLADGPRLLDVLHRIDGTFDLRIARCEIVLGDRDATVVATTRDGAHHEAGRIEFTSPSARDQAIAFGRAIDQILRDPDLDPDPYETTP